jgi:hypothetical protein
MALDAFISKFAGYSESIYFYDKTIQLLFDAKKHEYYLVQDGSLELIPGASSVCHIIDKSEPLIAWACKVMSQKLLAESDQYKFKIAESPVIGSYIIPEDKFQELVVSAKSAHKDKLDEASNIGKQAHGWIESLINYELNSSQGIPYIPMPENEQAKSCCRAAVTWMRKHNIRWISTEQKVYSKRYKYAGTMDGLCMADSCDDITCCKEYFRDALTLADWKTSNSLYPEYLLQTAAYQYAYSEEFKVNIAHRWVIRLGKEDGEFEPWHINSEKDFHADFTAFLDALALTRSIALVKDRLKEIEDEAKKLRKAAEKASKEAALTLQCKGHARYQGKRKPQCNGGNPCKACLTKYEQNRKGNE